MINSKGMSNHEFYNRLNLDSPISEVLGDGDSSTLSYIDNNQDQFEIKKKERKALINFGTVNRKETLHLNDNNTGIAALDPILSVEEQNITSLPPSPSRFQDFLQSNTKSNSCRYNLADSIEGSII